MTFESSCKEGHTQAEADAKRTITARTYPARHMPINKYILMIEIGRRSEAKRARQRRVCAVEIGQCHSYVFL